MFYYLDQSIDMDGKSDYLDISDKLHYFLRSGTLGFKCEIQLVSAGYHTVLAIYFKESLMPDFSIQIQLGCLTVTTRRGKNLLILRDETAINDGKKHILTVNGDENGITAWVDSRVAIRERGAVPYCEFGYVGFAEIGRGILQGSVSGWFAGRIYFVEISSEPMEVPGLFENQNTEDWPQKLFWQKAAGVENYRIPILMAAPKGILIAGADARLEAPGDNPNHISRAIRRSSDGGKNWSEIQLFQDFGGMGRETGAAALDGQFVSDEETGSIFMMYVHTAAGVGSANSCTGTGFDEKERRILLDEKNCRYFQKKDGTVADEMGKDTGYTVDGADRLYKDGVEAGSVCQGNKSAYRLEPTSYLQVMESRDGGVTWLRPSDLNYQVKKNWMCALGPGPGVGICIESGRYKGRLICPVYFSNSQNVYSSGVIYSDNHGKTWRMGEPVNDCRVCGGRKIDSSTEKDPQYNTGECQVVELTDGRIKIYMRNRNSKKIASACSDDGGDSWHHFSIEEQLNNPDCQFSVMKAIRNGKTRYYLTGPDSQTQRVNGCVWMSDDETETWKKWKTVECGEFGYSCMSILPDGNLGILYEGKNLSIYFKKIDITG